MLKKSVAWVIATISTIVLFFDFINVIDIENMSIRILLSAIFIVTLPIAAYSIIYLIILRKKDIVIDGLNLITLNHEFMIKEKLIKYTRKFNVAKVNYIYEFKEKSFTSIRTYKGTCISLFSKASGFPVVLAGDHNATYKELNCYAFDLICDIKKERPIYPQSSPSEGLFQLSTYHFSNALKRNQEFHIEVSYTWPDCVKENKDYILASPIFHQKSFDKFNIELRFFDRIPIRIHKIYIDRFKKEKDCGWLEQDIVQESKDYICFTDCEIEMTDTVGFFVYIYTFHD